MPLDHADAAPGLGNIASMAAGATPYGAIAEAAGGLISGISGIIQKAKANKWLKNNPYPIEALPDEVKQNQEMARLRANTGLPSEQYNNAMKNIQRQQLLALRGAQDRHGGLALVGALDQQGNDAVGNLDVADAQARLNNENQFMTTNNQVANWKSKLFNDNIRQKYLRDYEYNMNLKGAGSQNINSGLDKTAAGGLGIFGG